MLRDLMKCLFYGILVPIIPILSAILVQLTVYQSINLAKIFGNGELLLVTTCIVGTGISELLFSDNTENELKFVFGTFCFLIALTCCIYFGSISVLSINDEGIYIIEKSSYWLFGGGLVSSLCSVTLAQL